VLTILVGETVALDWGLAIWASLFFLINHVYFVLSEEPGLVKRFGGEYVEYRRQVPRWIPRLEAYRPGKPRSAPAAAS
jgi:protein-S-isoprenylcysteine O-methyltransferase Ste14